MIKQMKNLPTGTIGFTAEGRVTADDYENVVRPALKRAFQHGGTLNLVYVISDDVTEYTPGALWKDTEVALRERTADWGRIAVVTNLDWVQHGIKVIADLTAMKIKIFTTHHKQQAIDWAVDPGEG